MRLKYFGQRRRAVGKEDSLADEFQIIDTPSHDKSMERAKVPMICCTHIIQDKDVHSAGQSRKITSPTSPRLFKH